MWYYWSVYKWNERWIIVSYKLVQDTLVQLNDKQDILLTFNDKNKIKNSTITYISSHIASKLALIQDKLVVNTVVQEILPF